MRPAVARWTLPLVFTGGCIFNFQTVRSELEARYDESGWTTLHLEMDELLQPLRVEGRDEEGIDAEAVLRAWLPPSEPLDLLDEALLTFVRTGDAVELTTRYDGAYAEQVVLRAMNVSMRRDADLEIECDDAGVEVVGMTGAVRARTEDGSLSIQTRGDVDLTAGGPISVSGAGGQVTGGAAVHAVFTGEALVTSESGPIVATLGGDGELFCEHGDVHAEWTARRGTLTIVAEEGGATLVIPAGAGYHLTAVARDGRIEIDPGVAGDTVLTTGEEQRYDGTLNGGGPATIHIEAGDGAIRVVAH